MNIKLTEEERRAVEVAVTGFVWEHNKAGLAVQAVLRRVLAAQPQDDDRPRMDQLEGWCSWAAHYVGCAGSNERALGLKVQEILAAVSEFMRDAGDSYITDDPNGGAHKLTLALRKLVRSE